MESDEINPSQKVVQGDTNDKNKQLTEYDAVTTNYKKFKNPQFESNLNIPLSHSYYA